MSWLGTSASKPHGATIARSPIINCCNAHRPRARYRVEGQQWEADGDRNAELIAEGCQLARKCAGGLAYTGRGPGSVPLNPNPGLSSYLPLRGYTSAAERGAAAPSPRAIPKRPPRSTLRLCPSRITNGLV